MKKLFVVSALMLCTLMLFGCDLKDDLSQIICDHQIVIDQAVEATCTSKGKTAGAHCELCDKVFVEQESIPKTKHTPIVDAAVEATCAADGLTEGKHCGECGEVLVKQKTVEKKKHTVVLDESVDATCVSTGLTEGEHCSECGEILIAQETVKKRTHTVVIDAAIEATCIQVGMSEGKHCSACDEVLVESRELGYADCVVKNGVCQVCSDVKDACAAMRYYMIANGTRDENGYLTYVEMSMLGGTISNPIVGAYYITETASTDEYYIMIVITRSGISECVSIDYIYGQETLNVVFGMENETQQIQAQGTIKTELVSQDSITIYSFECSDSAAAGDAKDEMKALLKILLSGTNDMLQEWNENFTIEDIGFVNYNE